MNFRWPDLLLAALILVTALATRSYYLMTFADNGFAPVVWQVQGYDGFVDNSGRSDLDVLVEQIKTQGPLAGFRAPAPLGPGVETTAHLAPLFPWFRAGHEWLGEQTSLGGLAALRWKHVGLGAFACLFVFLAARRAFQSRLVGLIAGTAAACYPFWIVNCGEPTDGVLATTLFSFALFLGVRAGHQGGALTSLLLGLTLAALSLTRAAFLPFAFVAAILFLLRCRALPLGWLCALVLFCGFAGPLAAWTVRCYQDLGEPLPVVSSTWWHVWVGNSRLADGTRATWNQDLATLGRERLATLEKQPQSERYAALANDVITEVTERPKETMLRRVRVAAGYFFAVQGSKLNLNVRPKDSAEPPFWLHRAFLFSFLGVLALAFFGWRWSFAWRRSAWLLTLALYLLPLPYLLAHAEVLHGPRLPLDAVFLCLAALAVGMMIPGVRGGLLAGEAPLLPPVQVDDDAA